MAKRSRPPDTRKGFESGSMPVISDDDPTAVSGPPSVVVRQLARERSAPIKVMSMKTPEELAGKLPPAPASSDHIPQKPQLRSMAEVAPTRAALGGHMGNLAPPRDTQEVRGRRARSNAFWGAMALAIAVVVAALVWLLGR
jgi:hypothetical protein